VNTGPVQALNLPRRLQHSGQLQLCVPQIANGSPYCPQTPRPLFSLGPLPPRGAAAEQTARHDAQAAELARYKFAPHAGDDAGGYRREMCPAVPGKIRCALRPQSMIPGPRPPRDLVPA
jgi:hypothetical protein